MTAEDFKQETESIKSILTEMAQHFLHNKEDADDIVQDVLIKLWGMREELHRPMIALARVLTRNLCIDHLRQHPVLLELNAVNAQEGTSSSSQCEMIERMMNVVDHLPPKQQLVLRLRHMNGMSFAEISQLTGDSEANVRQILCRARQNVKAIYCKNKNQSNN